jgi:predicted permease
MLKNYLVGAYRSLVRNRATSLINLAGLTLGISGALILFLLIRHFMSFDRYHAKRDRIFRMVTHTRGNGGFDHTSGVPAVLPDAFRTDFPEAEEVTFTSYRAGPEGNLVTIHSPEGLPVKFSEPAGITFAEPNFFKIFDRRIISGSAVEGLDEPNEVILSVSSARKYFGTDDAIGKVLHFEKRPYRVSAIMEDPPANTDFPFHVMLSYITIEKESEEQGWGSIWSDQQCYVLLKERESPAKVEARLPAFVEKYMGKDNVDNRQHFLQPLAEIHHDDRYSNYNYNTVPRPVIITLGVVAVFLILTACINFINLSTAEAVNRSKGVGIRKALGGTQGQLIIQYLGESTLLTLAAVVLSVGVAQLALVFLNPFLELSLSMNITGDRWPWLFLLATAAVVSLLSGAYPATVVSAFRPAFALKNLVSTPAASGFRLRRYLVVAQFFISQFFLIGTLVLIRQMDFVSERDLGFVKEAILTVPVPEREAPVQGDGVSTMRTLRDELSKMAGIGGISLNSAPPSSGRVSSTDFSLEGSDERYGTQVKQVDGSYFEVFELQLVAGEPLPDFDTATGFVVNERLVKLVSLANPQDILGRQLRMWGRRLPVIGVVRDFHTTSLENSVEPLVLMNRIRGYESMSVKVSSSDLQAVIGQVQARWEAAYPEAMFSYEFLDEQIRGFYDGSRRISVLFAVFTGIAICIGCLGLLGLAAFMASRRTKEVGVRKVLGASLMSIVVLFSREFIALVFVGFLLAAPAAWYFGRLYLDQFAYRIELGPGIFATGIAVSLLIALATVGFRTLRAAAANPAESLRYE